MSFQLPEAIKNVEKYTFYVFCPSKSLQGLNLRKAKKVFAINGIELVFPKEKWIYKGYLAGAIEKRTHHLNSLLARDDVKVMISGRGGAGALQLLNKIDINALIKRKPWIIGYSDICFIHSLALSKANLATIHGPNILDFSKYKKHTTTALNYIKKIIAHKEIIYTFRPSLTLNYSKKNTINGYILVFNLSILSSLIGTEFLPSISPIILIIEDVNESIYALERYLFHIRQSNFIRQCSAIVLGGFTKVKNTNPKYLYSFSDIVKKIYSDLNLPIFNEFPVGHKAANMPILNGGWGTLQISPKNSNKFELKVSPLQVKT